MLWVAWVSVPLEITPVRALNIHYIHPVHRQVPDDTYDVGVLPLYKRSVCHHSSWKNVSNLFLTSQWGCTTCTMLVIFFSFFFFSFFFFFAAGYRCLAVIANSSFAVHIHLSIHPSIHPLSTTYPGSSHGGSRLRRVFQTSFSPATLHRVSSQLVMPGTPFKGGAQEAS